jgi:NADPH-dependent 2,4-dienoyl-CoA reductase/sulfur reductase-like enzyme
MSLKTAAYQVIIIGAGLAGLSAAEMLSGLGAKVLLLDEGMQPGGQYLKRPLPLLRRLATIHDNDKMHKKGMELLDSLNGLELEIQACTQVLGLEPDSQGGGMVWGETKDGKLSAWRAPHIILAAGARERFIPFKGWTLPGVISTGAVQLMLKGSGILPADKVMVAGCGPLPLAVAGELVKAGARVPHVWDPTGFLQKLGTLRKGAIAWEKAAQAIKYQALVMLKGGRLRHRVAILEARGSGQLEEVVTVRINRSGKPKGGSERVIPARCLAVGHGFVPNIELAQQAGCELEYDADRGGWVVRVDAGLNTSLPGIYAAGEITGIAGAKISQNQGCRAAYAIVKKLELGKVLRASAYLDTLTMLRKDEEHLAVLINRLSIPPAGLWDLVPDNTIICRCEDITFGQVRPLLNSGVYDLSELKRSTRAGMGPCQGRTCGPILEALAQAASRGKEPPPPLPARAPVKPFRLSALLDLETTGDKK